MQHGDYQDRGWLGPVSDHVLPHRPETQLGGKIAPPVSLTGKRGQACEGAQQFVFNPVGGGDAVPGNRTPDLKYIVFRLGRKLLTGH